MKSRVNAIAPKVNHTESARPNYRAEIIEHRLKVGLSTRRSHTAALFKSGNQHRSP